MFKILAKKAVQRLPILMTVVQESSKKMQTTDVPHQAAIILLNVSH
jgi:hypothetical protein